MKLYNRETPKVLLLGNGINKAFGFPSWEELLSSITSNHLTDEEIKTIEKMPYPLQPVVLTDDSIDIKMKKISSELTEFDATVEEKEIINKFIGLPFDSVLTTNYTYEIEKSINPSFKCKPSRVCKYRKKVDIPGGNDVKRRLHTYFEIEKDSMPIWHIHGEAAIPDTMILGHYYYGKLLSRIQQYISKLLKRYHHCLKIDGEMDYKSWVDYFMLGDVFIVGQGMNLSEMDLWWMVNCKKRNFQVKIYMYKPDATLDEILLMKAYGINLVTEGLEGDDYKKYYNWLYENIANQLYKEYE